MLDGVGEKSELLYCQFRDLYFPLELYYLHICIMEDKVVTRGLHEKHPDMTSEQHFKVETKIS